MRAKFTENKKRKGAAWYQGKATIDTRTVAAIKDGKIHRPVQAEWYMGRSSSASVVYCNVWVNDERFPVSGTGVAGGYGYHKVSAAFAKALTDAGVELYGSPYGAADSETEEDQLHTRRAHIAGCGDTAVNEALKSIARTLGYEGELEVI